MSFIFKGRLCGYLCPECTEPLSGAVIRLYRPQAEPDRVSALAVAAVKTTLGVLTLEQVEQKTPALLAETVLDDEGYFAIELGDQYDYDGGPIEVDVYCKTVPRLKDASRAQARQFSVTTLEPEWKDTQKAQVLDWDYCLPAKFWCGFRSLFGAWTICGHCVAAGTGIGVPGVTVSAFDVDLLEHDALGIDTTDATGHFRIDYATSDFEKTPLLIPWELTQPGPDVYFKAMIGSAVVLDEPPARGRAPDRQDVGTCFCVELEVDVETGPPVNNPHFTHVGDFHVDFDLDAATGKTLVAKSGHGGPDYGFGGVLRLRGYCPKTNPSNSSEKMRYRFLYEHPDNPGVRVPITGPGLVDTMNAGSRLVQWDFGAGLVWVWQDVEIRGSGVNSPDDPTPAVLPPPGTSWGPVPIHVIVPDSEGWIAVDQRAIDNGFFDLLEFKSAAAVPGGAPPAATAGSAVPAAQQRNGSILKIVFEAATLADPTPIFTNMLDAILVNNWTEVRAIGLQQFLAPGATACTGITTDLDIKYTIDHELLKSWSIGITTAASVPGGIPALPAGAVPRGAAATHHQNVAAWPSCSYTVSLSTQLKVTDGLNDDPANTVSLTFCK